MNFEKDLNFIYKLFFEINENYINKICEIFDQYIITPGIGISKWLENEIDDFQQVNFIKDIDQNHLKFQKRLKKLKGGEYIYNMLRLKLFIFYDFVSQILFNENTITKDWEKNIVNFYTETIDSLNKINKSFISKLRSDFPSLNFIQKVFKTVEEYDKEYEILENNIMKDQGDYNYTLETIFRKEESLFVSFLLTSIEHYINNEKTKTFTHIERKWISFDSSLNKQKYIDANVIQISDNNKYDINSKIYFEAKKFQLNNFLKTFYNIVFIPFILRIDYTKFHSNGIYLDNSIIPKVFPNNHPLSPYASQSLIDYSNLIKLKNDYRYLESQYEEKTILNVDDNILKEAINYRQWLSYMLFLIENLNSIYNLNFSLCDHIYESIEKNTIFMDVNIKLKDDPNMLIMKEIKNLYHINYMNSILKIQQENFDINLPLNNELRNDLKYLIEREKKINLLINNENIIDASKTYTFLYPNVQTHDIIELIKNNLMNQQLIDDFLNIINKNNEKTLSSDKFHINKNLKNKEIQSNPFYKVFKNNIKEKKFRFYDDINLIVFYNTILIFKLILYCINHYDSKKKLFYSDQSMRQIPEIMTFKNFQYYVFIPYFIKSILPKEKSMYSIPELQPPSEKFI